MEALKTADQVTVLMTQQLAAAKTDLAQKTHPAHYIIERYVDVVKHKASFGLIIHSNNLCLYRKSLVDADTEIHTDDVPMVGMFVAECEGIFFYHSRQYELAGLDEAIVAREIEQIWPDYRDLQTAF